MPPETSQALPTASLTPLTCANMVSSLLFLLSSAYLASQASASAFPPNPLLRLSARQDEPLNPSDIPPQCLDQCAAIVVTINTCTTTACLCSTTVEVTLVACVDCIVSLAPTAGTIATGQKVIDDYVSSCASADINLPTPIVSIVTGPPPPLSSTPTRISSLVGGGFPPPTATQVTVTVTTSGNDGGAGGGAGTGVGSNPAATSGASAKGPTVSGALGFGVTAGSRLMCVLVVLGGVSVLLL